MLGLKNSIWIIGAICVIFSAALASSLVAADFNTDEQVIDGTYRDWVAAANAKDIERWATFLAPNAIFLPPNNPALTNEVDIKKFYIALFADERSRLDCRQERVEISLSKDLAWSTGHCLATFTGSNGEEAHDKSKWAKVWIRMESGEWKCIVNSWSSTLVR